MKSLEIVGFVESDMTNVDVVSAYNEKISFGSRLKKGEYKILSFGKQTSKGIDKPWDGIAVQPTDLSSKPMVIGWNGISGTGFRRVDGDTFERVGSDANCFAEDRNLIALATVFEVTGFIDAKVTPFGKDAGIEVSKRFANAKLITKGVNPIVVINKEAEIVE